MKKLQVAQLFALVISLTGCLQSPLFSHANASSVVAEQGGAASSSSPGTSSSVCPLSFSKSSLCASVTWLKQPTADDQGEFTLRFWDATQGTEAGPYVAPIDEVGVKLWMPSMGHGSSPAKIVSVADATGAIVAGVFDVQNIFFVMNGTWQVFVQLKKDKQVLDQAEFDYQF